MNIQTLLAGILKFLNDAVVPFLLAIAALVFFYNIARFFIIGGANEESREKARSLAIWGVTGFVIIISLWGIVNLLVVGLGFNRNNTIVPDYMCSKYFGDCGNELPSNPAPSTPQPIFNTGEGEFGRDN